MKVAVLAGGRSSEHDISLVSAASVVAGLKEAGHDPTLITITRAGQWIADDRRVEWVPGGGCLDADVVFPVLHGPFGEDGIVQGLLELLDVAYVGSDVLASALSMNKALFKEVLAGAGIPQVQYRSIVEEQWRRDPEATKVRLLELGLPLFIKPGRMGSSIGMSKVVAADQIAGALETAFKHDHLVVAEQFSAGLEVECAVIGGPDLFASLPGEIELTSADWYDYEAKYTPGAIKLHVPARIPEHTAVTVRRLAVELFERFGCSGMVRADFFVDGEAVLVNEINTIPGFTPTSGYAVMLAASGMTFAAVCDRLVRDGYDRYQIARTGREF